MAYNFLGLVNDVCQRTNDVELTTSTFSNTVGNYSLYKQAVNSAIRYINQNEFEWPFNHTDVDLTLTAGTVRYAYPSTAKRIDFDTFRIKRNDTFGNETIKLDQVNYEEYLKYWVDDEYNTDTGIRGLPRYVARTPSQEFVIFPVADQAYEVVYESYTLPTDLENATDVPSLPEAWRSVIVDGAMYYIEYWREDTEAAERKQVRFDRRIDDMRRNYINRFLYASDRRIRKSAGYEKYVKVN